VVAGGLDFWQAISAGVFCPIGLGCVRFPALVRALAAHGFDGWATVEQDRDARRAGPALPDVIAGRCYLERVGVAEATLRRASVP
jgi:inosose dehydratase